MTNLCFNKLIYYNWIHRQNKQTKQFSWIYYSYNVLDFYFTQDIYYLKINYILNSTQKLTI